MGLFRIFSIVFFSIVLTACGGGGSSVTSGFVGASVSLDALPDGAGAKYVGKTTAAPINQQSATDIIQILFFDSSFVQDNVQLKSVDVNRQSDKFSNTLSLFNKLSVIANNTYEKEHFNDSSVGSANRAINETDTGSVSGSVIMSGDVSDNGLGTVTLDWNNYDDGDGYVVNGKSSLQVVGLDYDYQVITDVIQTYDGLKISYKGVDSFLYGEIRRHIDRNSVITQVVDTDSYDSSSELWKSYDNVKYTLYSQSNEYLVQGRFYRSDIGYINVSTQNRLKDCDFCTPKRPVSGGPLEIVDEQGSSILIRPVNEDRVRIEVANNETTEFSQNIYGWDNLDGEPLSNAAPQVSLRLSPYSPTLNDTVTATITINDPDLDETTSTIEWSVNGQVVEAQNTSVLAPSYFDIGDLIKVTVIVSDGNSTITRSDTVTVQNRAPTSDAGSDQILNIGQKIFLDGSNSSDPEGRELTYQWSSSSDAVKVVSPNNAQTEIILLSSGSFSVTLIVSDGKKNDYDYVNVKYIPEDLFTEPVKLDNLGELDITTLKANDVTGDGKKDLIYLTSFYSSYKPRQIAVVEQLDNGTLTDPVYYGGGIDHEDSIPVSGNLDVADMNNDGLNDVIITHNTVRNNGIAYFQQNDNGVLVYSGSFYISGSRNVRDIRIGDMNNDGLKDIICLINNEDFLEILIQNADGTFSGGEANRYSVPSDSSSLIVKVFDATGDGREDIVTTHARSSNDIYILPQTASGILGEAIEYDLAYRVSNFAFGDFNNNGLFDIASVYLSSNRDLGILYQTPESTFADPVNLVDISYSADSIMVGDINNDGLDDIVIYHYNNIGVYLQKAEGGFEIQQSFEFISDSFDRHADKKAFADINNDGFLDIIAVDGDTLNHSIRIMFGH